MQEWIDKLACAELPYRLARGLDRCDEAILRSVFHPDATDDHGAQFTGPISTFIPWVLQVLGTMERTQHFIGNVLVEVEGDRAFGESYFVAYHDIFDENRVLYRKTVAGRYLDRFERREGVWKIAHRRAAYDWNAMERATDVWDRSDPAARTAVGTLVRTLGCRGPADASYAREF